MRRSWFFLVILNACGVHAQQITVADGPLSRPPALQVDGEGRAFVAAGRQLLRLNRELVPEQNVTLSSHILDISLSSGGGSLFVCFESRSCAVYNTGDLSAGPILERDSVLTDVVNRVALFTAGDSFYVGMFDPTDAGVPGIIDGFSTIRLSQVGGFGRASNRFTRSRDYAVIERDYNRNFYAGFRSGNNAYYLTIDARSREEPALKVTRLCHATGCPGGTDTCAVTALYEERIVCGGSIHATRDGICGLSVVEDFAGITGTSILVSRCRQDSRVSNVICLLPVADIDRVMDDRYSSCSMGMMNNANLGWNRDPPCMQSNVSTPTCPIPQPTRTPPHTTANPIP
jgi:hypothetical protein